MSFTDSTFYRSVLTSYGSSRMLASAASRHRYRRCWLGPMLAVLAALAAIRLPYSLATYSLSCCAIVFGPSLETLCAGAFHHMPYSVSRALVVAAHRWRDSSGPVWR